MRRKRTKIIKISSTFICINIRNANERPTHDDNDDATMRKNHEKKKLFSIIFIKNIFKTHKTLLTYRSKKKR